MVSHVNQLDSDDILAVLQQVVDAIPCHFYYQNLEGVTLGCNQKQAHSVGFQTAADVIGKTPYDLFPPDEADKIIESIREITRRGEIMIVEEQAIYQNQKRSFISYKVPLRNKKGVLFGIAGISLDITEKKRAEQLEIANKEKTVKLEEQARYARIAKQAAHDIRSPAGALEMLIMACGGIPEELKKTMLGALSSINQIGAEMLAPYDDPSSLSGSQANESLIVSAVVLKVLTSKRYQHGKLPVTFHHHFESGAALACVKVKALALERVLSNVINNAVEALDGQAGEVTLQMKTLEDNQVQVNIADNGKGIPADILAKLQQKIGLTSGKKEGHGIGLTQVRDTIEAIGGTFDLRSQVGEGTQAIITLPCTSPPSWLATELKLATHQPIIVLDDEPSMLTAWQRYFELKQVSNPQHGCTSSSEAIELLKRYPDALLLADYELKRENVTGLELIQQNQPAHAVLVTSHAGQIELQAKIDTLPGITMVPKQLAFELPLRLQDEGKQQTKPAQAQSTDALQATKTATGTSEDSTRDNPNKNKTNHASKHVVLVEDDVMLRDDALTPYLNMHGFTTSAFGNWRALEAKLADFPPETFFCFDHGLPGADGFEIAKQLHARGYRHLILFSGRTFSANEIPDYLTVCLKTELNSLLEALGASR